MPKFPAYPPLTAPDAADEALLNDQSDSNKTKRLSLGGLKSWLQSLTKWVTLGMIDLSTYPAFLAYPTVSQSLTGAGAAQTFQANTEVYDQQNCYNNATYTFTVPAGGDGVYMFEILVTGTNGSSSRLITGIQVNATLYNGTQQTDTFSSGIMYLRIKLVAGDTVKAILQANPATIPTNTGVANARFSGARIA